MVGSSIDEIHHYSRFIDSLEKQLQMYNRK